MTLPNCKDCPFGDAPQVPGVGARAEGSKLFAVRDEEAQFDLVVVAMAPAQDEMSSGSVLEKRTPMVGASGQFLRKTLHQLGIHNYFITNCLLCPIPVWAKEADTLLAQECCQARLEAEIRAHNPKLLLALGDMPFHQLASNNLPIMENQGRLFLSKLGTPLVPVAHPAYYLRQPDAAYDFIECTRAGVKYLENNYHQVGEVPYVVVTEENVDEVIKDLEQYDILTVDAETSGFYALGLIPDEILEVGVSGTNDVCYIIPVMNSIDYVSTQTLKPYPNLLPKFKNLLEKKKIRTWNGFFDARFLKARGITIYNWFDGMLAHYCLDERQGSHGLKKVARVYLGAGNWEADIKRYLKNEKKDSYANIPTEKRWEYLAKDVCYTNEMCELLYEEVKDHWAFWNVLMPATRVFTETMYRGLLIDPYKTVEVFEVLQQKLESDKQDLWKLAEQEFNPRSAKQCIPLIFDKFKIPPHPKYGKSTAKKVMEEYRELYPIVDKIITYRESAHDISNYIQGFVDRIDKDFRVHPTVKMHGTVTGRISTSDPSIMNIKNGSEICEIVVAPPGRYIGVFDAKGMELRWFYMYAKDEVLRDILVNGFQGDLGFPLTEKQRRDPHFMIGAIAFGPDRAKELRLAAKTIVFGRIYLRGLASIEMAYGRETARKLVDTMALIVPKQPQYVKETKAEVRSRGYVESWFGRQRRFPIINSENRNNVERMACNMKIQSAGSDLNLLNFIHLWEMKDRWDIYPMFTIHDSVVVDMPSPDVIPEIKAELESYAAKIVNNAIPFPYDVKYGTSWKLESED